MTFLNICNTKFWESDQDVQERKGYLSMKCIMTWKPISQKRIKFLKFRTFFYSIRLFTPCITLFFFFSYKLNFFIYFTSQPQFSFPSLLLFPSALSPHPVLYFLFRKGQSSCGYQQSMAYQGKVGLSSLPYIKAEQDKAVWRIISKGQPKC